MNRPVVWIGQALSYAAFAGTLALFSSWPMYRHLDADQALIKLSIVHHGQRLEACRENTPEELAKLPPNMRAVTRCARARAPLLVEVDLDGVPVYRQQAPASGLARDGAATLYHRLVTIAGSHRIAVRLRDSARSEGFDYQREAGIKLRPAQILVIDFDPAAREIVLR